MALLAAVLALLSGANLGARAQGLTDVKELMRRIDALYSSGDYERAEPLAKRVLALAEKKHGSGGQEIVPHMRRLGNIYYQLGRYPEAGPLLTRVLEARERALASDHLDIASAATELANVYYYWQGHAHEAVPLYRKAAEITAARLGPKHLSTGQALQDLADGLGALGRHAEAEPLSASALTIREEELGNHRLTAYSLNQLAWSIEECGRVRDAEPHLRRALSMREQVLGAEHSSTTFSIVRLADNLQKQGRYPEVEPLYARALEIRERTLGPDHADVARVAASLGVLRAWQNKFAEAEALFRRALAIREKSLGPNDPLVGQTARFLAQTYYWLGRTAEAEPLFKRALKIAESANGPDHPSVGESLLDLATFLGAQDLDTIRRLLERALNIFTRTYGADSSWVAQAEAGLAWVYYSQGHYDLALPLYRSSLEKYEKLYGPDHPQVALILSKLAKVRYWQGGFAEAEELNRRALAIYEQRVGGEHYLVADILSQLGDIAYSQKRYEQGAADYDRARRIYETAFGPEHGFVAYELNALGLIHYVQGDWGRAVPYLERSTEIVVKRARLDHQAPGRGPGSSVKQTELERISSRFQRLVKAKWRLPGSDKDRDVAAETFRAAQWARSSDTGTSLLQMAARSAKSNPALAGLVRERQDLVAEWQSKDGALVSARFGESAALAKRLASQLGDIEQRIAAIDQRFANDFPDYADLVRTEPLSVNEVQRLLSDDEALIAMLDTPERAPVSEETFVWVVTRDAVRWVRSELGTAALSREVAALRCGLDYEGAWRVPNSQCAQLLNVTYSAIDHRWGKPLPFDPTRAHALYKTLFGEIEDLIAGKHLLVVSSGPLTQLPFHVLVTAEPEMATPDVVDYRRIAWFARSNAITVLPAVSSLKALRQYAKPSKATKPFLGVGNPLLDGPNDRYADLREAAIARKSCGGLGPVRAAEIQRGSGVKPIAQRGGIADVTDLRLASPLPETADELCDVAKAVGAAEADILLGARASEQEIKQLSEAGALRGYRIVHFATHGALAGEISVSAEPGLLLTPPEKGTETDDGYLSASEIGGLKLDADWVILSACNTAAAEAKDAEALSGLARPFFYAGARALLVSHWYVDSNATVALIKGAFAELQANPKLGRGDALRRSMLALIDGGNEARAHPAAWAPFIVVGEGGAAR